MPGPPPKHPSQRRRRNAPLGGNSIHRLPAAGREGDPPPWPFGRPRKAVSELWARLWRRPQAVMWERIECEDVVARYVQLRLQEMQSSSVLTELRQLEDRLGLSPMSMLRLRWEVAVDDAGEPEPAVDDQDVLDIRHRLKAVDE